MLGTIDGVLGTFDLYISDFCKKSGSMLMLVFCLGEIKNKGTMIIDEEGELDKSIRQSQLVEETID